MTDHDRLLLDNAVSLSMITTSEAESVRLELDTGTDAGSRLSAGQVLLRRRLLTKQQYIDLARNLRRKPSGPIPREVAGHRIEGAISTTGMDLVYRARDLKLQRLVALKVLRSVQDPRSLARFRREAKLVARLAHPHIVRVHEYGEQEGGAQGGLPWFTMELVEGTSLEELYRNRSLTRRAGVSLLRDVARAVDYAHRHAVVHRDLKPANILVDLQGNARVTDFGLARDERAVQQLTQKGTAIGTPYYMSPEQARGERVDRRADVYALGVLLYEQLTGQVPYKGASGLEIFEQIIQGHAPAPRSIAADLPEDLERVVLKAMHLDPDRRYATAQDLADDLDRWLNGEPVEARSVGPAELAWRRLRRRAPGIIVAVVVLALLAGATVVGLLYVQKVQTERRARGLDRIGEAVAALERGAEDEAWARYREAVDELSETDLMARLPLARALIAHGKPRSAATMLSGVERTEIPDEVLLLRAEAWIAVGDPKRNLEGVAVPRSDEFARADLFEVIRRGVRAADALVLRAGLELDRGNAQAASDDIEAALAADPARPEPWFLRGRLHAAGGEHLKAVEDFDAAIARAPAAVARYHAARGRSYEALRNGVRAIEDYDTALAADPDAPDIRIARGELLFASGKVESARQDFDRAVQRAPGVFEPRHKRAALHLAGRDWAAALADLEVALRPEVAASASPEQLAEAHRARGIALRGTGEREAALESFRTATEARSEHLAAWDELLDLVRGTPEQAGEFARFLALALVSPELEVERVRILARSGADREALQEASRLLEEFKSSPELATPSRHMIPVRSTRAEILLRQNRYAEALEDLDALALEPGGIFVFNRARCLHALGRTPEAVAGLREFLHEPRHRDARTRPYRDEAFGLLVSCYLDLGQKPQAILALDEALLEYEGDLDFHLLRGTLLVDRGRPGQALPDLTRVLAADPENVTALDYRGRARAALGDPAGAEADWRLALEHRPGAPELHYNLARLAATQAAWDEAWRSLERALENGWQDLRPLQEEEAFAPMRADPRFQELLDKHGRGRRRGRR